MPARPAHASRVSSARRLLLGALASLALLLGILTPAPATASLEGFQAGNLMSDVVFYNSVSMDEAQIQAFFEEKGGNCQAGYTCLKDFTIDSVTRPADRFCDGYTGAPAESAARIIARVSESCGINPQVLIVMLQKEQSLITHTYPQAWRYNSALGQGCPDTAPCDPQFVGFFHQIYGAARQLQIYAKDTYFRWYPVGQISNIKYHPNDSCGTSPVLIENMATASLYYYTPYQPNAAALAANFGEGDACSAYGNRNFYNYFTEWFGSTRLLSFMMTPLEVTGTAVPGQTLSGDAVFSPEPEKLTAQWYRDGVAIEGATEKSYAVTPADAGAQLELRLIASAEGYAEGVARSTPQTVRAFEVDRLAGADRVETAIAVSKAAWAYSAPTVYLATSLDYPDALSAGAAAAKAGASLLLTPPAGIPAGVLTELARLQPSSIVLMGGTGALPAALEKQITEALPNATITRAAGADRYATARAVAEDLGVSMHVVLATGRDFPDALSAAAAAGSQKLPVLLVDGQATSVDEATLATLDALDALQITIVGGAGVVKEEIAAQLRELGFLVNRLAGDTRYDTNAAVITEFFPYTVTDMLFATGRDFPDALAAAMYAGSSGQPLALVQTQCVTPAVLDLIRDRGTTGVTLVGGDGVLTPEGVATLARC